MQVPLCGGVCERVRDEHACAGGGAGGAQVAAQPRHLVGQGHHRHGLGKTKLCHSHIFTKKLEEKFTIIRFCD